MNVSQSNGWTVHCRKAQGRWSLVQAPEQAGMHKRHGLTGPIDDAFMDSFLFVRPTGVAQNERVGAWAAQELDRALVEWRRVFRGDARVKDDRDVTAWDIENCNLVLWGDPGGNAVLARLADRLPLRWTKDTLVFGERRLNAADHAPILIYPNPLNPKRYVVLNSSFTFRQGSTTSNSLQTPKLPDWALVDLRVPPGWRWPGWDCRRGVLRRLLATPVTLRQAGNCGGNGPGTNLVRRTLMESLFVESTPL
jgi:hypothetical protein